MCGEGGADERAGSGDRGEMMADQNPFIGGHEIAAVFQAFGGRGAAVVQRQNFRGDEIGIEAIRDEIRTDRGDDKPHRVERLAAFESDRGERARAREGDGYPHYNFEDWLHCAARAPELRR